MPLGRAAGADACYGSVHWLPCLAEPHRAVPLLV
jgi:hypothetical protein